MLIYLFKRTLLFRLYNISLITDTCRLTFVGKQTVRKPVLTEYRNFMTELLLITQHKLFMFFFFVILYFLCCLILTFSSSYYYLVPSLPFIMLFLSFLFFNMYNAFISTWLGEHKNN